MRDGLLGAPGAGLVRVPSPGAGPSGELRHPATGRTHRAGSPSVAGGPVAPCRATPPRPARTWRTVRLRRGTGNVALAPLWEGDAGRTPLLALALVAEAADDDPRPTPAVYLGPHGAGHLVADRRVLDALGDGFGPDGVGVVAHDAKELMRSLLPQGVDITGLAMDTAVAAYLLDPSTTVTACRTWPPATSVWRSTTVRRPGVRVPSSWRKVPTRGTDPTPPGSTTPRSVWCAWPRSWPVCAPRSWPRWATSARRDCSRTWSVPWSGCSPAWRSWGSPSTARSCSRSPPDSPPSASRSRPPCTSWPVRRSTSTRSSSYAPCSTRTSDSSPGARPRRGSRRTPGRSSRCAASIRSSRSCCATARWRSCAPPTANRWRPRSPRTDGSTPPSDRRWHARAGCPRTAPTCTTSRCAPTRAAASARRSSPRRAGGSSWPTTTRSSCGRSPTSRATPA